MVRFDMVPLDEEAVSGEGGDRRADHLMPDAFPTSVRMHRGAVSTMAIIATALLLLGLLGVGYVAETAAVSEVEEAKHVEDLGGFEVKESLDLEDLEDDWPVTKKEIKNSQYNPAGCFARLSFATARSASLGLKIRAAMQECNVRNYRDDPTPFRRLHEGREAHEAHTLPALPQEASIHYPTSPWAQYMDSTKLAKHDSSDASLGEDLDGIAGQSAYNLTHGALHLKTLFAFGQHWTVEGWHYIKDAEHASSIM